MKISLPKKCPICGSKRIVGNDKIKFAYVEENDLKNYYGALICLYACGAKIWLKCIHTVSGQMTFILNPCPKREKEEVK